MSEKEKPKLKDYLLGRLGESSDEIEAQLFKTEGMLEQLDVAEDELIEDYLDGRLDEAARVRFEEMFLTSKIRRAKLEIIRSLKDHR